MKTVPHWQWLIALYLILVGVPVMIVHFWLRKRLLAEKTLSNFLLYVIAIIGTAFTMHFLTMWLYFKFIFLYKL